MDLARLEFTLRPRSQWEALDIGFALARRWFLPLAALWLCTALPVALLLTLLLHDNLFLLSVLLWWGKPLYEPMLLFWLSRAVFGERLALREVTRQWRRIILPGLPGNLSWRRLATGRSFTMPVRLLEGLKGGARSARLEILGRDQHAATWLTIVGIHFETLLELGLLITLYMLIPEELLWIEWDDIFFSPTLIDEWLQTLCWLTAMCLIAPFYVAAGFSLYLHRRSELEGWDLEVGFRRTVERRQAARRSAHGAGLTLALCLALGLLSAPQPGHAAEGPTPSQSKALIGEVLAEPRFGRIEQESYWKYVGEQSQQEEEEPKGLLELILYLLKLLLAVIKGFLQGTADLMEVALWACGLAILAFLLHHLWRNAAWMQALLPQRRRQRPAMPTRLFGLDLRPESLPADIAEGALAHLQRGELRQALSLLYRGALLHLITDHQLEIPGSATEGECLALVREQRSAQEAGFFARLTRLWLATAYAHHPPAAEQVEALCQEWQQVYGHARR